MKRRRFLQHSVIGIAVGGAFPLVALGRGRPSALVEGDCADAGRFADEIYAAGVPLQWTPDSTDIIGSLRHHLADQPATLVGLTRPSGHLPVDQLVTLNGYRNIFLGIHDYAGTLSHRLQGPSADLAQLADGFEQGAPDWAAVLARQLSRDRPAAPSATRTIEIPTAIRRPPGSTGLLLSWIYTLAC